MVYFLRDLACYRRFRLSKGYFRGRLGFHRESLRKSILPSQLNRLYPMVVPEFGAPE